MFCPSCQCEFRSGFRRCESCDQDLVESLSEVASRPSPVVAPESDPTLAVRLADYCGFVSLEEARQARDRLRNESIRSEIAIREAPGSSLGRSIEEEYWLRIDVNAYREAVAVLGFDDADGPGEATSCARCGHAVADGESFCTECGAPVGTG